MGFPCGSDCKETACDVGDLGLIPGLGRSPGGGRGNPLQYSCLENPMDKGGLQSKGSQRVRPDWVTKHSKPRMQLGRVEMYFTSQMKGGACGMGRLGLGAPLPPHLCPHTYHIHKRTKSDKCTTHRFPVRIKWAMHENGYELQNVIKMWGVSVIASINTYSSQSWWN